MYFDEKVYERNTKQFSDAIIKRKESGLDIISMGLGEPDMETPRYVIDAMAEAIEEGYTRYSSAQGLLELRELIIKRSNNRTKIHYSSENVIILPGIKASIYYALSSILEPFDEVIYCTPCYVSYPAQIKLAEPTAKLVSLDYSLPDFSFNVQSFLNKITPKTKCILLANPNNPNGSTLSKQEVESIVRICVEKDIYIISDEVYDSLVFEETKYWTFSDFSEIQDRLIIVNGYSKSHAMTGWRLGYTIAPKEIIDKMSILNFNIMTNTTTFIQKAACSIYLNDWEHLESYKIKLLSRMNYFHNGIQKSVKFKGILPKAGFFYFMNIEETGLSSNIFCAKLVKKTGIAATPGIAFGDNWDKYVRFSLAVPMDKIELAIVELLKFEKDWG